MYSYGPDKFVKSQDILPRYRLNLCNCNLFEDYDKLFTTKIIRVKTAKLLLIITLIFPSAAILWYFSYVTLRVIDHKTGYYDQCRMEYISNSNMEVEYGQMIEEHQKLKEALDHLSYISTSDYFSKIGHTSIIQLHATQVFNQLSVKQTILSLKLEAIESSIDNCLNSTLNTLQSHLNAQGKSYSLAVFFIIIIVSLAFKLFFEPSYKKVTSEAEFREYTRSFKATFLTAMISYFIVAVLIFQKTINFDFSRNSELPETWLILIISLSAYLSSSFVILYEVK